LNDTSGSLRLYFSSLGPPLFILMDQSKTQFPKADDFRIQKPRQINDSSLILYFHRTAEESLNQSLFGVIVQNQGEVVGMGRVIGDGRIYFYIQDIAVLPEHQNKGIGKLIIETIQEYLKENAPEKSFVG
jgi:ribosomal protein S18 acetylase RimI-like enzyme